MKDRQVVEWDKDDIDALKFMKVDVLGLGMLGCMRRAFDLLEEVTGKRHDLSTIPQNNIPTYDMIKKADTLGTFQIESRAQMAMLPRMKPDRLYDLVIQVAIVRPGPIQGDMVHPYLRRRERREEPEYPKPELKRVLEKTLGVPLFQEQAMRVAIECAGFTAGEADQLRRAMATFKLTGKVSLFRDKLIGGMVANGYTTEFAEKTFKQLEGFGSYGFPESHAASFALIAYASSWVKRHHPDVFLAAILNSQPMGFYAPAQLVRDARQHEVEVLPPDVNLSRWDTTLEPVRCPRRSQSDREGDPGRTRNTGSPFPPQRRQAGGGASRPALWFDRGAVAPGRHSDRCPEAPRRGRRLWIARAWPAGRALGYPGPARRPAAAFRGGRPSRRTARARDRGNLRHIGAHDPRPQRRGGLPDARIVARRPPGRVPAGHAGVPRHRPV